MSATPTNAEQAALLDHLRHSNPLIVDGKVVSAPLVDGCDHCQVSCYMQEIHHAWYHGNADTRAILWSIQDGYGTPGYLPDQGYDWSGIRDSSPDAIRRMHAAIHA